MLSRRLRLWRICVWNALVIWWTDSSWVGKMINYCCASRWIFSYCSFIGTQHEWSHRRRWLDYKVWNYFKLSFQSLCRYTVNLYVYRPIVVIIDFVVVFEVILSISIKYHFSASGWGRGWGKISLPFFLLIELILGICLPYSARKSLTKYVCKLSIFRISSFIAPAAALSSFQYRSQRIFKARTKGQSFRLHLISLWWKEKQPTVKFQV